MFPPALLQTYNRTDIAFVRGEGSYLFAEDGRRYLDFGAGIAVNAFGYNNPKLVGALTEQAGKLWHTSNLYRVPGQESLAAKLVAHTFADTVFFTNSGAEACELAFKMARRYHFVDGNPERFHIVSFEGAFHGRTMAGIAATGQREISRRLRPQDGGLRPGRVHRRCRGRSGGAQGAGQRKDRRPDHRADPGRGRRAPRRARFPARLAQALRRQGHPSDLRRDPDRHGPHRKVVRP